jgi:uncharacterized protein
MREKICGFGRPITGTKMALSRSPIARRALILIAIASVSLAWPSIGNSYSFSAGKIAFGRGNYVEAARQLGPAARQGNAGAQAMLGFLFEHGLGVPQNYHLAAAWYTRAAEQGDATAQYSLGLLYDKGFGVPRDEVLAYKWLNLGAARASARQREYYLSIRDAVASKMTLPGIAEGQSLATEWMHRHLGGP